MTKPIGIRYYQLFNHGAGIIIYPQLVFEDNSSIWGKRFPGGGGSLIIGKSRVLDLAATSLHEQVFFLGAHTFWGKDYSDRSQAFTYDPRSNLVASAIRTGGVRSGKVACQGVKVHPDALGGTKSSLVEVVDKEIKGHPAASGGIITWLVVLLAALSLLVLLAISRFRRYRRSHKVTTDFELGTGGNNSYTDNPEPIQPHRSEALKPAK